MSATSPKTARRKSGSRALHTGVPPTLPGQTDRSPARPRTAPRPLRPGPGEPPPSAKASPGDARPVLEAGSAPTPLPEEQTPLLPGAKAVIELLLRSPERVDVVFLRKGRHSRDMERVADLCRGAGVRFALLEPSAFARVYSGNSQGIVARLYEAGYVELEELLASATSAPLPLLLALDQVQDPGNAGTLARTLYALGGAGMIAPRHNGVYLGAAAARAAAGALDLLPVSRVTNLGHALDAAREAGYAVYGATARAPRENAVPDGEGKTGQDRGKAVPPLLNAFAAELRLPAVLVLGSEESGMRPGTERRCDFLLRIPLLRDCDSVNVAQAGGILIGFFARGAACAGERRMGPAVD